MRQDPIVEIQHTKLPPVFFREVYVVPDINGDAVVVDWVQDLPVKRFLLGGRIMVRLLQPTVRNRNQVVWHRHTNLHSTIGFVRSMVFIRPPDTCPDSLSSRVDKRISQVISAPRNPTRPRRILSYNWNSFVENFNLVFNSLWKILFKHYPIDISLPFKFELRVTVVDLCDCQGWLQINLHFVSRFQGPEGYC